MLFFRSTQEILQLFKSPLSIDSEPRVQVLSGFPSCLSGPGLRSLDGYGYFLYPEREMSNVHRPAGVIKQGGGIHSGRKIATFPPTFPDCGENKMKWNNVLTHSCTVPGQLHSVMADGWICLWSSVTCCLFHSHSQVWTSSPESLTCCSYGDEIPGGQVSCWPSLMCQLLTRVLRCHLESRRSQAHSKSSSGGRHHSTQLSDLLSVISLVCAAMWGSDWDMQHFPEYLASQLPVSLSNERCLQEIVGQQRGEARGFLPF